MVLAGCHVPQTVVPTATGPAAVDASSVAAQADMLSVGLSGKEPLAVAAYELLRQMDENTQGANWRDVVASFLVTDFDRITPNMDAEYGCRTARSNAVNVAHVD